MHGFRFLHRLCLALLLAAPLAACDNTDPLPDDDPKKEEHPKPTPTDTTQSALTVAEAQSLHARLAADTIITVAGYIVGTAGQMSIDKAQFTPPFDMASNLLLADRCDERDARKCFPIRLLNGSEMRAALNLAAHPTLVGTPIAVQGTLSTYYRVAGIKDVLAWDYIRIDTPTDTTRRDTTPSSSVPTIDHRPQLILGGRSVAGRP